MPFLSIAGHSDPAGANRADVCVRTVRGRSLIGSCDHETDILEKLGQERRFSEGEVVVRIDEDRGFVGWIVSGSAIMRRTLRNGRSQIVGLLMPGDFVGQSLGRAFAGEVIAADQLALRRFRRVQFDAIVDAVPALRRSLFDKTLSELDATREMLLLLGQKNVRERVASYMLMMSRRTGTPPVDGRARFRNPLRRTAMAEFLGLALETVSRQVSELKREGLIGLDGTRGIVIEAWGLLVLETGDGSEKWPVASIVNASGTRLDKRRSSG